MSNQIIAFQNMGWSDEASISSRLVQMPDGESSLVRSGGVRQHIESGGGRAKDMHTKHD